MNFIILIVITFFSLSNTSRAAFHTDTHTYILCPHEDKLLIIDRHTGAETLVNTGKSPADMIFYSQMAYILTTHADAVDVLDLKTHTLLKTIPVGKCPIAISLFKDKAFVANERSNTVSVIDLKHQEVMKTIQVGDHPMTVCVFNQLGYVVNRESGTMTVLDLDRMKVKETITIAGKPWDMKIIESIGYITNYFSNSLIFVDLVHNHKIGRIHSGIEPHRLTIYDHKVFVCHGGSNTLSVFDCGAQKHLYDIPLPASPHSLFIHNDIAWVEHLCPNTLTVVDLKTTKTIATLGNPDFRMVDASDHYFYLGSKKFFPIPGKKRTRQVAKDFLANCSIEYSKIKFTEDNPDFDDLLNPTELADILLDQPAEQILNGLNALYRPKAFCATEPGQRVIEQLWKELREGIKTVNFELTAALCLYLKHLGRL